MIAYFDNFQIELTPEQAAQGSHPGQCDADIADLLTAPGIAAQLDAIPPERIAFELQQFGAWDETELQDTDQNRARILWIACGQLNEGCDPEPEEKTVTLIASGYEFICPHCETFNRVIETAEKVTCGECGHTFAVDECIHAEG